MLAAGLLLPFGRDANSASGHAAGFGRRLALVIGLLIAFLLAAKMPALVFEPRLRGLRPAIFCAKHCFVQGALLAGGGPDANAAYCYGLNEACDDFVTDDVVWASWPEILRQYGAAKLRGAVRNFGALARSTMAEILSPIGFTVLPFAIGLVCCWSRLQASTMLYLILFCAVHMAIVPAIHLETRYVVPAMLVGWPLMGIGLAELFSSRHPEMWRKRLAWFVGGVLILGIVAYGGAMSWRASRTQPEEMGYRLACKYLKQQQLCPDTVVMARNWNIYAYLGCQSRPPDR